MVFLCFLGGAFRTKVIHLFFRCCSLVIGRVGGVGISKGEEVSSDWKEERDGAGLQPKRDRQVNE